MTLRTRVPRIHCIYYDHDHDFHQIEVESELEFHLHRLIWFFLPFLPSLDSANNLLVM